MDRAESTASPMEPGTMVDHFKVARLVGRGGMGEVYLARDTKLGRKVALKLVHPEALGDERAGERFLHEARTTAKFSHPHIVQVHFVGSHGDRLYVALEYLEGETLRDRMVERLPSPTETIRIGLAIAEALAEAHKHGVLHRDLKPENVMMSSDGRLRVVDFGLAKQVSNRTVLATADTDDLASLGKVSTLTESFPTKGGLMGTPRYMAPEQWTGEEATGAIDIWALGVTLYELLGGAHPYEAIVVGRRLAALAAKVCDGAPVPALKPVEPTPTKLQGLVTQCLAKDPEDRPSATEVVGQLVALLHRERAGADTEENPFRGLLPFTEKHADLFFGRDAEVAQFLERLRHEPVLPVVGPSGAGKSSFVRAGVIPRLREQGPWLVLSMRPGRQPFDTLAARLLRPDSSASNARRTSRASGRDNAADMDRQRVAERDLCTLLRTSPARLSWELLQLADRQQAQVLLFVDQLEELHTLVDDEPTRERFMESICGAADDPESPVRVVLTVRDDFLGRMAEGPAVRAALSNVAVLRSPGVDALEDTLVKPVRAMGYTFEDPTIVQDILSAVRGEPAALALLQLTGEALWEKRLRSELKLTREAYDELGRVEGALARRADDLLEGLSSDETRLAKALLLRLVSSEGARRVLTRSELLEGLDSDASLVLDRLVQGRALVVRKGQKGGDAAEVELVHESLIRTWTRLARWVDEGRENLAFVEETERAAELWDRRGRRPEELWQSEALAEALRRVDRIPALPALVTEFLVAARRRSERLTRRRNVLLGAALTTATAVAAAAVIVAFTLADKERAATAARVAAEDHWAAEQREGAEGALERGELLEARAKLRSSLERRDSLHGRALWRRLGEHPRVWTAHATVGMMDVALSQNGTRVAGVGKAGIVVLFDGVTGAFRSFDPGLGPLHSVALAPDGGTLVVANAEGKARAWRLTEASLQDLPLPAGFSASEMHFASDGQRLVTTGPDCGIRLWDLAGESAPVAIDNNVRRPPTTLARCGASLSADGSLVAGALGQFEAAIWDAQSGELRATLRGHEAPVYRVQFGPAGRLVLTGSADRTARLWDATSGRELHVLGPHQGSVQAAFVEGGKLVVTASWGGQLRIWDVSTGDEVDRLPIAESWLMGLESDPAGKLVVSCGYSIGVEAWRPGAGLRAKRSRGHTGLAGGLRFDAEANRLFSAGFDGTIREWNVGTGRETRIAHEPGGAMELDLSPDGQTLAAGTQGATVSLWDIDSLGLKAAWPTPGGTVFGIAFSPEGRRLAASGQDGKLRIWDLESRAIVQSLGDGASQITGVDWSADGALLAAATDDGTARVWDVNNGTERAVLRPGTAPLRGISFSQDGSRVAAGDTDGAVRVFDLTSPTNRWRNIDTAESAGALWLAFHPDGKRLGVPGGNGRARIWNIETSAFVELRGHARGTDVNFLRFSRDGRLAATSGDDQTVRVWDAETGHPVWWAPVLLDARTSGADRVGAELYSQVGWSTLRPDGAEPNVSLEPTTWRQAIERRTRLGRQSPNGRLLCLLTQDEQLELWDPTTDQRIGRAAVPSVRDVVAFDRACATLSADGTVRLATVGAGPRPGRDDLPQARASGAISNTEVASNASAIAVDKGELLVAAEERIVVFGPQGEERGSYAAPAGVSSLLRVEDHPWFVVGLDSGLVEIWPRSEVGAERLLAMKDTPSGAVLQLLEGPKGLLAVGAQDGTMGLWNLHDGIRLETWRLHGPVVHLMLDENTVYTASELGDVEVVDLGIYLRDYCALMRDLWDELPVVWKDGRAVVEHLPADHLCARR